MRTIASNYEPGDYASQLIPCCGHFFMAAADGKSVDIMGCPIGIDWTVQHTQGKQVKHITQSGDVGIISLKEYRQLVTRLVKKVEKFYQTSQPKRVCEDEFDRKGYEAFRTEWKLLKEKIR